MSRVHTYTRSAGQTLHCMMLSLPAEPHAWAHRYTDGYLLCSFAWPISHHISMQRKSSEIKIKVQMHNLHVHTVGPSHLSHMLSSEALGERPDVIPTGLHIHNQVWPHTLHLEPLRTQSKWMRSRWKPLPSLSSTIYSTWFLAPTPLCIQFRDFMLSKRKHMSTTRRQ